MVQFVARLTSSKPLLVIVMATLIIATGPFSAQKTWAGELTARSITMSNNLAGVTNVTYQLRATYTSSDTLGSILVQFCSEGPLPFTTCTAPAGLDTNSVSLDSQSGETGFSVFSGSPPNEILLTRPPSPVTSGANASYTFTGVQNPATQGQFFARVITFASSDASGPSTDTGGLALSINRQPTVNAEVPPYLEFCVGENITGLNCSSATEPFSDVGNLSPLATGAAQTQIVAATNGEGGYSMWVIGGTMASGNNVLPAMSGGASQKGVSQFGINLRANTNPVIGQDPSGPGSAAVVPGYNQQNQFRYQSGDTLASVGIPDTYRKYTVSYIVNVAKDQPGGVYATTLTFIALANF